jgi:hypothetical protein
MSTHTLPLIALMGLLNTGSDGRPVPAPVPGTTTPKAAPTSGTHTGHTGLSN